LSSRRELPQDSSTSTSGPVAPVPNRARINRGRRGNSSSPVAQSAARGTDRTALDRRASKCCGGVSCGRRAEQVDKAGSASQRYADQIGSRQTVIPPCARGSHPGTVRACAEAPQWHQRATQDLLGRGAAAARGTPGPEHTRLGCRQADGHPRRSEGIPVRTVGTDPPARRESEARSGAKPVIELRRHGDRSPARSRKPIKPQSRQRSDRWAANAIASPCVLAVTRSPGRTARARARLRRRVTR